MQSEQLVWVLQDVDYLETVVRREQWGTSHGVRIRITRGVYHRTSTSRSRPTLWEEMVHADTGLLGLTTKHIYYAGSRKKFRIRYYPHRVLRPLRRRVRHHAGHPDRQAPGIPHRRLVRLQPGDQPSPAPRLTGWTHPQHQPTSPVHTQRARKASDGEQILNHSALHRGRCGYGQLAPYWA